MNETKIRNGEDFHFGSDGNEGFVIWNVKLGKFRVFFNGSLIYSSEAFKAAKHKVKSHELKIDLEAKYKIVAAVITKNSARVVMTSK